MLRRFKHAGYRGDTIVEVMVVLAILGLALSISYATANRSLLDARQAQENSQATEYVLAQVEGLRSLKASTTQNIYQAGPYCINTATLSVVAATDPACTKESLYSLSITGVAAPGGDFTVTGKWDDIEGQGTDVVTMDYRIYQDD